MGFFKILIKSFNIACEQVKQNIEAQKRMNELQEKKKMRMDAAGKQSIEDEVSMNIDARLPEKQSAGKPKNDVGRNVVWENEKAGMSSPPPKEKVLEVNVPVLDDPVFYATKAGVYYEKNVNIPEGYTEIGEESFESCNLRSISFPSTLKKICYNAFHDCQELKQTDFSRCTSLQEIGDRAFYDSQLNHIDFSKCTSLQEIGEESFENCELRSISFPSALKKISSNAFYFCQELKHIDFSRCTSLQEVGEKAFAVCDKLEEIVLPDSVTVVGDECFGACSKLRKVVMPASLEELGDDVFEGCNSLEEIDLSKVTKLKVIPKGFETGNEKQMIIPMGVTTIRKDAFKCCAKYSLFLPPTLKNYKDTNGNWESVYLFAPPLDELDNIFENSNNLYVLPKYLKEYKSIHKALGGWHEIHPMPDEYLYFYDS